ncbi:MULTISPECIES: hypothetical protein [unclassified Paenibacillus]|uniref:hypothetical protein n=1 Tax=unclassified Paenibacillus TaxID=185978 RepID=UPI00363F6B07
MAKEIIITKIEQIDYGHKRLVHMIDTRTSEEYTMTFGDSVTEARIRLMAPSLIEKEKKKKRRY